MPRFDLHSHSTHSDGLLTPAALVARAQQRGVDVLALTDHDEVSGLAEATDAAAAAGIRLVAGTEISVSWDGLTIHIVGLGIDPLHGDLVGGLERLRHGRAERGRRMAAALTAAGIPGSWEGALRYVTRERLVSRTHFARYLVEAGRARSVREVFNRFLVRGKPGYVAHEWARLDEAVGWITGAGGRAVIAHPGRYPVTRTRLRRLLGDFRDVGGTAVEVLSASHTPAQAAEMGTLARVFGLWASVGSDYHGPGESWLDLGSLPPLPAGTVPVWHDW